MDQENVPIVQLIPIEAITIANPRVRNQRVFRELVESIAALGLKKPITVTYHPNGNEHRFELICGQGRLEAYQALGEREIPAFVVEADTQSGMVMSLVENVARRQHRAIDLLHDIEGLKRRGYSEDDIAKKTALTVEYVRAIIRLTERGESRLLSAVEAGHVPVSIAVAIADADDAKTQQILQQAYETKKLRGRKLLFVKRLIARRKRHGKDFRAQDRKRAKPQSVDSLLRTYRDDTDKKRLLVRKAEVTREKLDFVTAALRTLLTDDNFTTLLRAEKLETLPRNLGERINSGAR